MKRFYPVIYSVSAIAIGITFFACNNNTNSSVGANHDPQPGTPASCPPASVNITIPQGAGRLGTAAFGTNPLVIAVGTSVTWVNQDEDVHTATAENEVWDTGPLAMGESSMPIRFEKEGNFPYSDAIGGRPGMSGVIQVIARPSGCPMPAVSPVPSAVDPDNSGENGDHSADHGADANNDDSSNAPHPADGSHAGDGPAPGPVAGPAAGSGASGGSVANGGSTGSAPGAGH